MILFYLIAIIWLNIWRWIELEDYTHIYNLKQYLKIGGGMTILFNVLVVLAITIFHIILKFT